MDPVVKEILCPHCRQWVLVRVDNAKDWVNPITHAYTESTTITHDCSCGKKFLIPVTRHTEYVVSFRGKKQ